VLSQINSQISVELPGKRDNRDDLGAVIQIPTICVPRGADLTLVGAFLTIPDTVIRRDNIGVRTVCQSWRSVYIPEIPAHIVPEIVKSVLIDHVCHLTALAV
jgi:hypothetical protein